MVLTIQKRVGLLLSAFSFLVLLGHWVDRAVRGVEFFMIIDLVFLGLCVAFFASFIIENKFLKAFQIIAITAVGYWQFTGNESFFGLLSFTSVFFLSHFYGVFAKHVRGRMLLFIIVFYGLIVSTQKFGDYTSWIAAFFWLLHISIFVSLIWILFYDILKKLKAHGLDAVVIAKEAIAIIREKEKKDGLNR